MRQPFTIRNVLAGFFLLLFAFCITPKRTLHNLVASHTDKVLNPKQTHPYQSQLNQSGFNCQVDNLITESPFLADSDSPSPILSSVFFSFEEKQVSFMYSSAFFCSGLRGPPVC